MSKVRFLLLSLMLTIIIGIAHAQDNSSAKKGPKIEFEKLVHDFGNVPYNGDGYCEFRFTNTGDAPLLIQKPKSSCGCFSVKYWPQDPIPPGKSDVIKAKYHTARKGVIGVFNKKITVQSNAINNPIVYISAKGTIIDNENLVIYDSYFTGKVSDQNKNGIANAIVTATNKSDGQQYSTKTDTDGEYRLFCPEGNYEICATHYAYQSKTKNFDLASNHTPNLKFKLERVAPQSIANNNSSNNTQNQNLASNSNSSGGNNVSNNSQNGNSTLLNSNDKSTSNRMNLTDGLVAYYHFEGPKAIAYDESEYGNHGDISGINLDAGYKGQCYHFPNPTYTILGWTKRIQCIRIPNSNSLKFDNAASFAFWFKLEEKDDFGYVGMMDNERGDIVPNSGLMKFFSKSSEKGQIHGGINLDNRCIEIFNNYESCSAGFQLNKNWNHVVMIVTNSYFKIYLNGKEMATKSKNMNFRDSNSKDLIIGSIPHNCWPFHGWLDEFLVYNRELNKAEVASLYEGKEPDGEYLAYKRIKKFGSLKDAVAFVKDCNNATYKADVENEILNSKINSFADVVYCNDNYPKFANSLEDKMFGFIGSASDCEAYLRCYPSSERRPAIDDKMYQYLKTSSNINDCEAYLKLFPNGNHNSAVVAQKNEIAGYNVAINGGKAECNAYLQKYPNGRFVSEIQARIDYLSRKAIAAEKAPKARARFLELQEYIIKNGSTPRYEIGAWEWKENPGFFSTTTYQEAKLTIWAPLIQHGRLTIRDMRKAKRNSFDKNYTIDGVPFAEGNTIDEAVRVATWNYRRYKENFYDCDECIVELVEFLEKNKNGEWWNRECH